MNKKFYLLPLAFAVLSLLTLTSTNVYANVFASDIKVVNPGGLPFDGNLNDGTPGVGIQFRLNENATSVTITVKDGSGATVATIDAGPHGQGLNQVVWSGLNDAGDPVPAGDYTFSVTASDANGHSAYDMLYAKSGTRIFTRGGTTIRNPAAANFGHPIGGNGGGGGLKRGPLNFFADGTGFENFAGDPDVLARYSPFDVRDFGGVGRLYMLTSDEDGNLYYSDRLDDLSKIYRFSPDLDPASLKVIATSDDSAKSGLGIAVVGTGAAKTIYWGLANTVVRMTIGTADTFDIANAELVATFGDTIFIRDVNVDDSGFLYVSLRKGNEPTGDNPGVAVERYDISGVLPVTRADAQWSIPVGADNGDGRAGGLSIDRGTDPTNVDDRVYFSNGSGSADGKWNGVHKIDDLATGGSTLVFEDISGSHTTSSNADVSIDAAGNIVFFENSSEWLFSISPPDGPNSFTTPANDVISITDASAANAFPGVNSVEDIPGDQGFQVSVTWAGSALDRLGNAGIATYEVYRKVEDAPAGASKGTNGTQSPPGKWELVGSTSARQTSNYGLTVPTLVNDATTYFYVSAVTSDGTRYDSKMMGGTSVDNLIPTAPSGLIASEVPVGEAVGVALAWNESPDEDFNYFAVVRGSQPGFDVNSAEEVGTTTQTEFTDASVQPGETWYYRVVAFDFSGNKGDFSEEVAVSVTSVAGGDGSFVPESFNLEQNYPNPFNPTTSIRYDLAKDTHVSLKIYNMMGQEVATLVNESKPAGRYEISWNARNDAGLKVSSGIYIYVLKAGDFVKSARMTLLK